MLPVLKENEISIHAKKKKASIKTKCKFNVIIAPPWGYQIPLSELREILQNVVVQVLIVYVEMKVTEFRLNYMQFL